MKRTVVVLLTVLAATGVVLASAAVFGLRAPANSPSIDPVLTEAKWPFPIDQWGIGRAFVCAPADCGTKVEIYVRPKIGFCNCATGVSDDAELEGVADTDLVSRKIRPPPLCSKPRAKSNRRVALRVARSSACCGSRC